VKIVLNTSPIIFLGKIESLGLLQDCVDDIYAPKGVIDELRDYTYVSPNILNRIQIKILGDRTEES
jgi:predicted nucleic acid-binding protein